MKSSELASTVRAALGPIQALVKLSGYLNELEQLELEHTRLASEHKVVIDALAADRVQLESLLEKIRQADDEVTAARKRLRETLGEEAKAKQVAEKTIAATQASVEEARKAAVADHEVAVAKLREEGEEIRASIAEHIKELAATRDSLVAEVEALRAKFL